MHALRERSEGLANILSVEAGLNPLQDREYVGYIKAVNDLVNMELIDLEESKDV